MKQDFVGIFEADSVIKTLSLCVITIGVYLIYKLYYFSVQINRNTEFNIPKAFIVITIVLFVTSLTTLIYGLANIDNINILKSSIGIHIISSMLDVTWIVMVSNRINLISNSCKGDKLWLNPLFTSVFHVIYMQYKINQGLIDVENFKAKKPSTTRMIT